MFEAEPTLDWRMVPPSLAALKKSQQKQVQTTKRSVVLRQGLEVNIAMVDPSPPVIFIFIKDSSLLYPIRTIIVIIICVKSL